MISSRDLNLLLPIVQQKANQFIAACRDSGIEVLITSTYRDHEAQDKLYAQGRTTPGHVVTAARGGDSLHNWKCAFDFVPIINGKAQWEDIRVFNKCGEIAESVGLEWAGRWRGKFRELAHCQYTGGLSITDLKAGKTIGENHV